MSLIVLQHAHLAFGGQVILSDVNLRIGEGDRIGLIGANGSGKSTLLKALAGQQALDGGELQRAKGSRIGYLPQDVLELAGETLLSSVLCTVPGRDDIAQRLADTEQALAASGDPDEQLQLATALSELREQLDHFETYYSERRAMQILAGLGFRQSDFARPTAELSGGWKMRGALAGLLFQSPDVLFLDEPTNHLDVPSVRWFEGFLAAVKSAVVLICHDREFLNRQIDRVISFEPEGLRSYRGDYEAYLEQRAAELEVLEARARNRERELRDKQRFVERFKAKATKARQAQSRAKQVKRLQRQLENEQRPESRRKLSFSFPEVARSGRDALQLAGIAKRFGELSLYRDLTKNVYAHDRVAIVGVNGAGKTTLLKIMAGELAADEGEVHLGANVEIGYYAQHHTEQLDRQQSVLEEVWRVAPDRAESTIRGICGAFLFSGDDVEKAVGVLSGGERARVLLARLLVKPGNLLLMDEPTNHLDLASSEALAEALATFGGTLVFVSHNSSFVNRLATKVWDIVDGEVIEYPGNLRDYLEHLDRLAGTQGTPANLTDRASAPAPDAAAGARQESQRERKERKRHEAERRNKLSRATQKVRKRIAELEQRISELERAQQTLEPQLADPDLYRDKQRFQQTLALFEGNRQKLEELYGRWEHQQHELERIEQEASEVGD